MINHNVPKQGVPNRYPEGDYIEHRLVSWATVGPDGWAATEGVIDEGFDETFTTSESGERIMLDQPKLHQKLIINILGDDGGTTSSHTLSSMRDVVEVGGGVKINIVTPKYQDPITYICEYPGVPADESLADPEINTLNRPYGYFDAQVRFARKWSEITGEDFSSVLYKKTAIYRKLFLQAPPADGPARQWYELLDEIDDDAETRDITELLFDAYTEQPWSKYTEKKHPRAFGYGYDEDTKTIKIHFSNPVRGESPFSDENMPKLREHFRQMLIGIKREHPEAEQLMSATWVRSTKSYRSLSPPDIAEAEDLMSPEMHFGGDSVWGQFIDKNGQTNVRNYNQFIEAVEAATTLDELVAAFPLKTLKAVDPIQMYYDYYGIE